MKRAEPVHARLERRADLIQETYYRLLRYARCEKLDIQRVRPFVCGWPATSPSTGCGIEKPRRSSPFPSRKCWTLPIATLTSRARRERQELEQLARTVGRLPTQCRRAFTLRKVFGMSQKEVATALSISEHTVEQHLAKAARLIALAPENRNVHYTGATLLNPFSRRMRPANL